MDGVQEALAELSKGGSDGVSSDKLKDFKKRKLVNNVLVDRFLRSRMI